MNRRDFLHPRNLYRPAGQILGAVEEIRGLVEEVPDPTRDAVLLHFSRRAMATTFEVILPFDMPEAQLLAGEALDLIDRLEAQLTVYRDDSEVSLLNQRAAREPVAVEVGLFQLLALCQKLTEETGGAFDVAVGGLVKAWGFYRRAGRVPALEELQTVRARIGMRHVQLDPERRGVLFQRPGLEINLGSIGKGYAIDRVLEQLQDHGCDRALIHGGHSSVFALGSEPGSDRGWAVGLLDPEDPEKRLAVLRLQDHGLGTSAATYQHLEYQGRKLPHLLDPRTCWPAEGMRQATVTAPSAALADALATAFFILGVDQARAYCESHPEIGAILVPGGPAPQMVVLGAARREMRAIFQG